MNIVLWTIGTFILLDLVMTFFVERVKSLKTSVVTGKIISKNILAVNYPNSDTPFVFPMFQAYVLIEGKYHTISLDHENFNKLTEDTNVSIICEEKEVEKHNSIFMSLIKSCPHCYREIEKSYHIEGVI